MAERMSAKYGGFYGCTRFPLCVGTRPGKAVLNSYTKLLHEAYAKALVFLSSPRLLGAQVASLWLMCRALDLDDDETVAELPAPTDLTDAALEKAIDAAVAYVVEHGFDQDFLVLAHSERLLHIKSKFKANITPDRIRALPKPAIVRRYDEGTLLQLEAAITADWNSEGMYCPRCGSWAEKCRVATNIDGLHFDLEADDDMLPFIGFNCTECGEFKKRGKVYVFTNDVGEPGVVPGIALDAPERMREEDRPRIVFDVDKD